MASEITHPKLALLRQIEIPFGVGSCQFRGLSQVPNEPIHDLLVFAPKLEERLRRAVHKSHRRRFIQEGRSRLRCAPSPTNSNSKAMWRTRSPSPMSPAAPSSPCFPPAAGAHVVARGLAPKNRARPDRGGSRKWPLSRRP